MLERFLENFSTLILSLPILTPTTQESKIEGLLDQVLEGQQKLNVEFNGKIDVVYTNLNDKFEALNSHVNKLETQVVETIKAGNRHESLFKGKGEAGQKHHVNAII